MAIAIEREFGLFIGGEPAEPASGEVRDLVEPATGEPLAKAAMAGEEDVDRAVTAGLGARWAAIGPFETMDLAGLDVHAAVAENLWPDLATTNKPSRSIEAARERGSIRADFDAEELKARRDRVLRLLREA